jgi:hypothetical protein
MEIPKKYLEMRQAKETHIHSAEHALADELCEYFNEKNSRRFGQWLGIVKKHGTGKVYMELAKLKEQPAIVQRSPRILIYRLVNSKSPKKK